MLLVFPYTCSYNGKQKILFHPRKSPPKPDENKYHAHPFLYLPNFLQIYDSDIFQKLRQNVHCPHKNFPNISPAVPVYLLYKNSLLNNSSTAPPKSRVRRSFLFPVIPPPHLRSLHQNSLS